MTTAASRRPRAEESRFRGRAAVSLEADGVSAVFVPNVGMTGVSLRFDDRERLALPGGLARLHAGRTSGLPLLAPWANRLASRRYRSAGVAVDLHGLDLPTDGNGLPMHGLLAGSPDWRVTRLDVRGEAARLAAAIDVDGPAFPFPHRIEVAVEARGGVLAVDTTVVPTRDRPVPVAFGWHPYLRLPGVPRPAWTLRLPPRRHLLLDTAGIPTGAEVPQPAEAAPIGRRRFDDLFALGDDRRLRLEADDGQHVELHCGPGYPCAQVWVPPGRSFAALEPMAAPTNALVSGAAPIVEPGDGYTARFTLTGS